MGFQQLFELSDTIGTLREISNWKRNTYQPRRSSRMTCNDRSRSHVHGASQPPTDCTHNSAHSDPRNSISAHPAVFQTPRGPVSCHDYSDPPTWRTQTMNKWNYQGLSRSSGHSNWGTHNRCDTSIFTIFHLLEFSITTGIIYNISILINWAMQDFAPKIFISFPWQHSQTAAVDWWEGATPSHSHQPPSYQCPPILSPCFCAGC